MVKTSAEIWKIILLCDSVFHKPFSFNLGMFSLKCPYPHSLAFSMFPFEILSFDILLSWINVLTMEGYSCIKCCPDFLFMSGSTCSYISLVKLLLSCEKKPGSMHKALAFGMDLFLLGVRGWTIFLQKYSCTEKNCWKKNWVSAFY